jgi:hypothetical protein
MKIWFVSLLSFITLPLLASDLKEGFLSHPANKITDNKIYYFHVLGERCSGTNYVEALVEENFEELSSCPCIQKHFIPWYLDKRKINSTPYYKVPRENLLYIVVIRNALDWLRSFYEMPHHVDYSLRKMSFTDFLRAPWKAKAEKIDNNEARFWKMQTSGQLDSEKYKDSLAYYIDRMDPVTKQPFKNVLHLRTRKYQNYLQFSHYVNNIIYVKYEDVLASPQDFIQFVAFLTESNPSTYYPILTYKGDYKKIYKPKQYFDISNADKTHILSELDLNQEKEFGYNYNQ